MALRNAAATAAGVFLSIATALFIARMAASVSFADTALIASWSSIPPAASVFFEVIGATFWKP